MKLIFPWQNQIAEILQRCNEIRASAVKLAPISYHRTRENILCMRFSFFFHSQGHCRFHSSSHMCVWWWSASAEGWIFLMKMGFVVGYETNEHCYSEPSYNGKGIDFRIFRTSSIFQISKNRTLARKKWTEKIPEKWLKIDEIFVLIFTPKSLNQTFSHFC